MTKKLKTMAVNRETYNKLIEAKDAYKQRTHIEMSACAFASFLLETAIANLNTPTK